MNPNLSKFIRVNDMQNMQMQDLLQINIYIHESG